ncbi:MAG: patatin-like phospholipase family protein, partial [Gammaproteobacteria bacterium]|nr:patatin-like phospholipase family protein [Gammaproteobacteria bacterium]
MCTLFWRNTAAQLLILATLLVSPWVSSDDKDGEKIGLVLSGGGARGLAHIGVLRALEEKQISISAIAGTSMGAVIGALYATGKSPDEIETLAAELNWGHALEDDTYRENLSFRKKQDSRDYLVKSQATIKDGVFSLPKGIVQGQNLEILLQRMFVHVREEARFDDFRIPFRAVAADLATGEAVILARGSL